MKDKHFFFHGAHLEEKVQYLSWYAINHCCYHQWSRDPKFANVFQIRQHRHYLSCLISLSPQSASTPQKQQTFLFISFYLTLIATYEELKNNTLLHSTFPTIPYSLYFLPYVIIHTAFTKHPDIKGMVFYCSFFVLLLCLQLILKIQLFWLCMNETVLTDLLSQGILQYYNIAKPIMQSHSGLMNKEIIKSL